MPLVLSECTDADFDRVFELLSLAFAHDHPYIDAVFPQHDSASGRQAGATRLREGSKADPDAHFVKVTDTEHQDGLPKVIAVAKWNIYKGSVPTEVDLDGPWWDNGVGSKDYAREFFRNYLAQRRAAIRESGGNLVSLDIMVVDPAEQRRGAGKILMDWGIAKTNDLKVKAVVEASDSGAELYKQYGFRHIKTIAIDMPAPWEDLPKQAFHWMVRDIPDNK